MFDRLIESRRNQLEKLTGVDTGVCERDAHVEGVLVGPVEQPVPGRGRVLQHQWLWHVSNRIKPA